MSESAQPKKEKHMRAIVIGILALMAGFVNGVADTRPKAIDAEKGYHHLMNALHNRDLNTCEQLEHDGTTCLRVRGLDICAPTRDGAAEKAAIWIEKNIPIAPVECKDCEKHL